MFPVRCFTCGKPIGQLWKRYDEEVKHGLSKKEVLDTLNVTRYCCRRMFLSHVELDDKLLLYDYVKEKKNR